MERKLDSIPGDSSSRPTTRRSVLRGAGGLLAAGLLTGLAGCTSADASSPGSATPVPDNELVATFAAAEGTFRQYLRDNDVDLWYFQVIEGERNYDLSHITRARPDGDPEAYELTLDWEIATVAAAWAGFYYDVEPYQIGDLRVAIRDEDYQTVAYYNILADWLDEARAGRMDADEYLDLIHEDLTFMD